MQLLNLLLIFKRVTHHVDRTWNVWIGYSCEEGFAAVDKSDLGVLKASLVLRARPTIDEFPNGAVFAGGVNEHFVERRCGFAVRVSILILFGLSFELLGVSWQIHHGVVLRVLTVQKLSGVLLVQPRYLRPRRVILQFPENNLVVIAASGNESCVVIQPHY